MAGVSGWRGEGERHRERERDRERQRETERDNTNTYIGSGSAGSGLDAVHRFLRFGSAVPVRFRDLLALFQGFLKAIKGPKQINIIRIRR